MYYTPRRYKNNGSYDNLADISEHIILVQLIDYLGKANHDISVIVKIPEDHYAIIAIIALWSSGITTKLPNTEEQMMYHTAPQHFSSPAGPVFETGLQSV